jgi:Protein kinase domain
MAGLLGRTFGGYQLVEQLPGGGIADVYRGRPTTSGGRDVVIKVIYPEFAHQPGFLPHFRQIVASSGKLANHPHVLPLLASGEDSGYLYLVTPYVEAGTLRDWMRKGGRMGVGDVAPFFRQLCDALTYAHSLGVVHGNLKPSNIFLFEGRHVLVGEFGLLWDVSHMDMNHAGSGTEAVEFLAPEVLSGQITQLGDIYGIGALLFAALTGHAPFQAATPADVFAAAARQPVPRLAQAYPGMPSPAQTLDSVIQKAMEKRPGDRFPSAAAVAQSIEASVRQAAAVPALPVAAPFSPMSAPLPPGSVPLSPPAAGPTAYPGLPVAMAQGGAGAAFPAPAISLAQAAAAIGAGAVSSLAQLDPPFPPLPATAQPEPQMEQARKDGISGGTGMKATVRASAAPNLPSERLFSDSTAHVPAPFSPSALPLQATMRIPAPGPSTSLYAGQQPEAAGAAAPASDAPIEQRTVRISGAPRAKLGRPADAPFLTLDDDDVEDFAPPALPVVRPPAAQNGFAVAGGAGSFDPGARGMSPPQNGAFSQEAMSGGPALDSRMPDPGSRDQDGYDSPFGGSGYDEHFGSSSDLLGPSSYGSDAWHNGHDDYTGEQRGYTEQSDGRWGDQGAEYTGAFGEQQGGSYSGYTGEYGAQYTGAQAAPHYSGDLQSQAHSAGNGQPFSATQLGLPRLTSPVLADQPPSWQEILSDTGALPGGVATGMPNARSAPGERAPTWEDAGESMWQPAVQPPRQDSPYQDSHLPQHIEAEWMGTGIAGSWDASQAPADKRKKKDRRAQQEEPEDSGFDDDRVWTVGTTAVRPRRRWPRKLALLLLLIALIDLAALVVLRPDLCPTQSCRTLSTTLRHQLGLAQNTPAPAPLTANPSSITLTVAVGKSATTVLTIKNATGGSATWKATAGLPWVTLNPSGGSLAANGTTGITITAKPANIKAGTYTTTITITLTDTPSQTVTIPVTINVTS